jgi:hypothetical protein
MLFPLHCSLVRQKIDKRLDLRGFASRHQINLGGLSPLGVRKAEI